MIPLFSAAAANAGLNLESAIARVVRSNWYILGEEVRSFESEFAAYIGVPHCVTLANGTDALELALRALGVGAGDVVACVANAGFYGSTAIHSIGAIPLYVDIDSTSLNMSPASFDQALGLQPKVVIVTHLYGQMADIMKLTEMAHARGVPVIEDCAQAHGARNLEGRVGSFGDMGCFSFYPTKNLGAIGDGGAVVCRDAMHAASVRTLRQYGWSTKYHVDAAFGANSRLDEIQAAVLREKLPMLDAANEDRRRIARRYNEAFADLPIRRPPSTAEDYVGHLYVIGVNRRDALRENLRISNIASDVHYPVPDHRQAAYAVDAKIRIPLPNTEKACDEVMSLPCFPGLGDSQVEEVAAAVVAFYD